VLGLLELIAQSDCCAASAAMLWGFLAQEMPRPFTKLKALDMDELIQKMIAALKE
jgi:hypothetical protein